MQLYNNQTKLIFDNNSKIILTNNNYKISLKKIIAIIEQLIKKDREKCSIENFNMQYLNLLVNDKFYLNLRKELL